MTVLSVVQNASLAVGLDVPSQVFSSTDRDMQSMARMANLIAVRIARVFDWQAITKKQSFTGDGVNESFALPADYGRMLRGSSLWSSRYSWQMNAITGLNDWLEMEVFPTNRLTGSWALFQNQIHVRPTMPSGELVKFYYIRNTIVVATDGTLKTRFSADTDSFALSEYLLELGIIWQWRASKGLPYAEDKTNYEIELGNLMDADRGSKPTIRAKDDWRNDARTAFAGVAGGSNTNDPLPDGYSIIIGEE